MTNVITLPGVEQTSPGEPMEIDPDLLATAEKLVERIKNGVITSLAYCGLSPTGAIITNDWVFAPEQGHEMAAAVGDLYFQFMHDRAAASVVVER